MQSVVISLLVTLRASFRDRAALHLEILPLRHQLCVVNRSRPQRLRLTPADRLLWVWLANLWNGWRAAIVIVKPETVLAWHRRGFRYSGLGKADAVWVDRSSLRMSVS